MIKPQWKRRWRAVVLISIAGCLLAFLLGRQIALLSRAVQTMTGTMEHTENIGNATQNESNATQATQATNPLHDRQHYQHIIDIQSSTHPVQAAGKWIYQPQQAIHYTPEHLQCLDQEPQGNCYRPPDPQAEPRAFQMYQEHMVTRNPHATSTENPSDPYIWQANDPAYQTFWDPTKLTPNSSSSLLVNRTIYLIGDSLMRQWAKVLRCELIHILHFSTQQADQTIVYKWSRPGLRRFPLKNLQERAQGRDIIVYNIGLHTARTHYPDSNDSDRSNKKNESTSTSRAGNQTTTGAGGTTPPTWQQVSRKYVTRLAEKKRYGTMISPRQVIYRTTTARFFPRGVADFNSTKGFHVGATEPRHTARWEDYGGIYHVEPRQTIHDMHTLMDLQATVQVLDTATPTLARADATYDAVHVCLPGPMTTWSRMLYHRLWELEQHDDENRIVFAE